VFLASFVFVLAGARYVERARDNRAVQDFLAGVSAAVVGVILVVSFDLVPEALVSPVTVAIAALAFVTIVLLKADVAWVAGGAIATGIAYSALRRLL